jgi:hypothetical protein
LRPSAPEPFQSLTLSYENAFGGEVREKSQAESAVREERNPLGKGYYRRAADAVGNPLPNIERPDHLIDAWDRWPSPAGFGPVSSNWSPRKELAGTFDDRWRNERMPLWPEDHDPRHFQSAPPELSSQEPLRGGEPVELINLASDPEKHFRLPKVFIAVTTAFRGERYNQSVQLDRVILQPDEEKILMVWRSCMNCHNSARRVEESVVFTKRYLR